MEFPDYDDFLQPLLTVLHAAGGSAALRDMETKVAENMGLSEEAASEIHRGNTTKLSYRLAWARTYLRKYGLIENTSRGVWSLTEKGRETTSVDKDAAMEFVKALDRKRKRERKDAASATEEPGEEP